MLDAERNSPFKTNPFKPAPYPIMDKRIPSLILLLAAFLFTAQKEKCGCVIDVSSYKPYPARECLCLHFVRKNASLLKFDEAHCMIESLPLEAKNTLAYLYYDMPTGRQKVYLYHRVLKRFQISDWFDDSAMGDSVLLHTFDFKRKQFQVFSQRSDDSKTYPVRFR